MANDDDEFGAYLTGTVQGGGGNGGGGRGGASGSPGRAGPGGGGGGGSLVPSARISQSTAIEQTRAVAEVMAQVEVAQRMPRDMERAIRSMQTSCQQASLAERAFYRYPKGKKPDGSANMITGPSVHLARELARCFGNVQYGLVELSRGADQSEMMVFAWDVETNTRSASTFIVPHRRDTSHGQIELTDLRDVYENNANQAARRLREAIFSILPPWLTEDAKERCAKTLQGGKDAQGNTVPLEVRCTNAVDKFMRAYGVRKEQLEAKLGARIQAWTEYDLATLAVVLKSLTRGEARLEDEFPAEAAAQAAGADVDAQAAARAPATPDPAPQPEPPAGPSGDGTADLRAEQEAAAAQQASPDPDPDRDPDAKATGAERGEVLRLLGECGIVAAQRGRVLAALCGHPVKSPAALTGADADTARGKLGQILRDTQGDQEAARAAVAVLVGAAEAPPGGAGDPGGQPPGEGSVTGSPPPGDGTGDSSTA